MVMHARKVARLDDGYSMRNICRYRDLNQPEILSKDKGLSNSHSTKYNDRKASKFDNFDHRRRSNSPRSRSGHYDNKPRERRNYEDTDSSNRDSKTKEQKHKDHKSEVHRLAERVCGDWSEHISKSGKRYFYNCRTEVSQWEKPDCWVEENSSSIRNNDKVLHDSSDRSKSSSSSKANSHIGDSRHSITNNKSSSSKSRKDGRDNRGLLREDQRSPVKNTSNSRDNNLTSLKDRASRQDRKRPHSRRSSSRSPAHSQKSGKYGSRGSSSEAGSGGCYRNSSGKNDPGNGGIAVKKRDKGLESSEMENSRVHVTVKETDDNYKNSPVHEDMDISPDNSFSQSEVETRTSQDGLNTKFSPHAPGPTSTPSGTTNVASSNGDTAHSDRPSIQAPPSSSTQEPSFHSTSSVAPTTAASGSSSGWAGPNASNPHPQQQSLQTTLAGLQQAVLRLIPDKVSASVSGQQSQSSSQANFANCVALLPVLLAQLSSQQQAGSGSNNSDNQLIIQQAIPLLKKLQEIVVHQQQQQQQRKLQHVLFQLLQMQNSGSNVHANSSHKTPGNDKAESPYSPPDSDGSPVQTPSHNRHVPHHHNRQAAAAAVGNRQSPRQPLQESGHQSSSLKQNRQEKGTHHQNSLEDVDERLDGVPISASLHSKMDKSESRPSMNSQLSSSSAGSQTPSHHHINVPFYRRNEIEITPSLVNYFNPNIIEHVSNWQADSLVKQADCIAADNYSYLVPLCCQVSVELKQARSMVRAQEILSTRHEQRRIFIQHQLYELDRGLSVPSLFPPNPILMTFTQQQALPPPPQQQQTAATTTTPTTTHAPQPPPARHVSHPPPSQPTPVPTPLSPPTASSVPPHVDPSSSSSSPPPPPESSQDDLQQQQQTTSLLQSTSISEETPCESSNMDLT